MEKLYALSVYRKLSRNYPRAGIALHYSNAWELLVAVILSAQSTDKQINKITKTLFKKYRSVYDYAHADIKVFENDIRSSGFFRNKARHIIESANIVVKKYGGKVPDTMDELTTLPGVARKTANIVLSNAYGKVEGIAVDTHVIRLSQRLGLTKEVNPVKIERDLSLLYPKKYWVAITYMLIEHGRTTCNAKRPKCDACFLNAQCPSAYKFTHFT